MNTREENRRDFDLSDTPEASEYEGPLCCFCDSPLPYGETDYCDALCAAMAERDNDYDR